MRSDDNHRRRRSSRSGRTRQGSLERYRPHLFYGFFALVLAIGGAGSGYPLLHWLQATVALVVLGVYLPALRWRAQPVETRIAFALTGAALLFMAVQIVPLPQGLWAGMAGHDIAARLVEVTGVSGWRAWSVAPDRTLSEYVALLPALAALVAVSQETSARRHMVLRLVVYFALFCAGLGVLQAGAGPEAAPVLFQSAHRGFGIGLLVNRNHTALFLLIAIVLAGLPGIFGASGSAKGKAASDRDDVGTEWAMRGGALLLLSVGVLATMSRTGVMLTPLALAVSLYLQWRRRVSARLLLAGLGALAVLIGGLWSAPPVRQLMQRYASVGEDFRFQYWTNSLDAVRENLPWGTGFGTFTLVYPTYEPLNEVRPDVVNHAHNDFLELLIEGGVVAGAMILAWIGFVALLVIRARRNGARRYDRRLPLALGTAFALTLLASLVDFPLRMTSLLTLLAAIVAMLLPEPQAAAGAEGAAAAQDVSEDAAALRWRRRAWAVPLVALGALAFCWGWSDSLLRAGRADAAVRLMPWSSDALAEQATQYEIRNRTRESSAAARAALALAPLNPAAVRAEGMASLILGQPERGSAILSTGARLGWRDGIIQLWLIEQALAAGANTVAVQRIDALLRQEKFGEELLALLPPLLRSTDGRAALSEQLAFSPGWRTAFFNAVARDRSWTMADFGALMRDIARSGRPAHAEETQLIRSTLADAGRFADARRVWLLSGGSGLIADGGFAGDARVLPPGGAPYVWRAPALTGVRVETARAEGGAGNALTIASDGIGQGPALAQTIVLAEGRYRLRFMASSPEAGFARSLRVELGCREGAGQPFSLQPLPVAWSTGPRGTLAAQADFAVPPGCPGQELRFVVPQREGRPFSVWLDSVTLQGTNPPGT